MMMMNSPSRVVSDDDTTQKGAIRDPIGLFQRIPSLIVDISYLTSECYLCKILCKKVIFLFRTFMRVRVVHLVAKKSAKNIRIPTDRSIFAFFADLLLLLVSFY